MPTRGCGTPCSSSVGAALRERAAVREPRRGVPPRSLESRAAESHDRVAWEERVVSKVAERVGAKPEAPAVPRGSGLRAHVEAAYDAAQAHAERPLEQGAAQPPPDGE